MTACTACGRPLALVRPTCLYCGAALAPELVAAAATSAAEASRSDELLRPAAAAAEPPRAESGRVLLVLDLRRADVVALTESLGVSRYEAEQRRRRGGYQLWRIADSQADAARAAEPIEATGVRLVLVPERELAREPLCVARGRLEPWGLAGRSAEGPVQCSCDDLLLAVQGPIQREFQVQEGDWRRPRSASPTEGYRIHLHRVSQPRPLELDPAAFEFEGMSDKPASSLLRMTAWIQGLDKKPLVDDGFRSLPAALSLAEQEGDALRAALRRGAKPSVPVLDNLRQFRFYSAWRAAVARRTQK